MEKKWAMDDTGDQSEPSMGKGGQIEERTVRTVEPEDGITPGQDKGRVTERSFAGYRRITESLF
jgi:hypothetical protein